MHDEIRWEQTRAFIEQLSPPRVRETEDLDFGTALMRELARVDDAVYSGRAGLVFSKQGGWLI
jgi:hypothetical protein